VNEEKAKLLITSLFLKVLLSVWCWVALCLPSTALV